MQRTVNLVLVGTCNHRNTRSLSAYWRFQRFLSAFAMPLADVERLVLSLLPCPQPDHANDTLDLGDLPMRQLTPVES